VVSRERPGCLHKALGARGPGNKVRRFIFWAHIGDPADLTIDLCQTFLFSLITRGMAAGTVNCYRAALSSWCNWLVRKGYLSENVALSCRAPRIVKAPPIYLTETEQAEVEVWAMALEVAFPVRVALLSGLRVAELGDLTWESMDLEAKMIQVVGKGKKWRPVPMGDELLALIKLLNADGKRRGPVFAGASGLPWSRGKWVHLLDPLRVHVPKVYGWHIFRHTFATRLVQRGCSIAKISKWMGHANIQVTLDYYANLAPENYDDDINLINTKNRR
jgi:integrase